MYKEIKLDQTRARYWLGVGAQPTDTMRRLLGMVCLGNLFHPPSGRLSLANVFACYSWVWCSRVCMCSKRRGGVRSLLLRWGLLVDLLMIGIGVWCFLGKCFIWERYWGGWLFIRRWEDWSIFKVAIAS